jgi:hypothetical protein
MNLSKDLREFVALLNAANVKYVLVGGHAVAFHGHPRFTGDVDFFIEPSLENGARLAGVFADFGFGDLGFRAEDFIERGSVIQLGRPPNRIDILPSIDGVEFADAWATKIDTALDGLPVHMIGKEMLLRNKRATARPQDAADVEKLS